MAKMELNPHSFEEVLRKVIDPISKEDIISTGKVRTFDISNGKIEMELEVLSPALHIKRKLENSVREALHNAFGEDIEIDIRLFINVPDKRKAHADILPGVKNIIAVSSGKGGVGKSTVSANLAVTLARQGFKVGLIDADIYGPSIPMMFDVENRRPNLITVDGVKLIEPVESLGVKLLSIGFFADVSQAVVWRGPMASKALKQMFSDAYWGELDFLLIDLPPGTGDVHLTLVQTVPVTGAIVVSTPQKVALADAEKGANMFRLPVINVPLIGMVENMAYFTPEELPGNKYYIFGQHGVRRLCEKLNAAFLGEIPLVQAIREGGDSGQPMALTPDTPVADAFAHIADSMMEQLAKRNENLPPTEVSMINTN